MNIGLRRLFFALHQYNPFFLRLSIALVVDFIVLLVLLTWLIKVVDIADLEIFLLEALFVINIGFAVISRFVAPRFYLTFLINSLLSVILFRLWLLASLTITKP
jgi:hypothetical protein